MWLGISQNFQGQGGLELTSQLLGFVFEVIYDELLHGARDELL